jgi:hypothetical protein
MQPLGHGVVHRLAGRDDDRLEASHTATVRPWGQALSVDFSPKPRPPQTLGGTQIETGRSSLGLARMDVPLVALQPRSAALLGRCQLQGASLSTRRLAWHEHSRVVGVDLKAELDDVQTLQAAPLLAPWDGQALLLEHGHLALPGYGGDISATGSGGFVVGCPLAHSVAHLSAGGQFVAAWPFADACALNVIPRGALVGGAEVGCSGR